MTDAHIAALFVFLWLAVCFWMLFRIGRLLDELSFRPPPPQ